MQINVDSSELPVESGIEETIRENLMPVLNGLADHISRVDVQFQMRRRRKPGAEVLCVMAARVESGPCVVARGQADSPAVASIFAGEKLAGAVRYYLERLRMPLSRRPTESA